MERTVAGPRIADAELRARRRKLFKALNARDGSAPSAAVLFGPTAAFYLTGFSFIPTERPLAVVVTDKDHGYSAVAFVPGVEREHAEATALVDEVVSYEDYPGEQHPMELLAKTLVRLGLAESGATLAADYDGYGGIYGYRGPRLSEVLPDTEVVVGCRETLEEIRAVKSAAELALIAESVRWANLAHRFLQDYVADGANETDVSVRASLEASAVMAKTLGDSYEPRGVHAPLPAIANFRGQIGPNSAFPHAIARNLAMRAGDVLVTGATALVWGYRCELERTMFVGEPSAEQRRYFGLMLGAQETALDAMRPGTRCADVDLAVRKYYESEGIADLWRHHTGHAAGIEIHEGPFLDVGDETVLEPGMVFTVEPGIYVPGLGGFRHSDTVAVSEDGVEMMTYYPRDLESMVCAT